MTGPTPIEQIKERLSIVDLVAESFEVTGRGRTRSTKEHDSLILWPETNTWHWYSRGIGGDVIDWWQHIHRTDFAEALRTLADKAGVVLRPLTPDEQQDHDHRKAHQRVLEIAAAHYHRTLTDHPAAADAYIYAASRGWTDETIRRERIGYVLPTSGDNTALSTEGWIDLATQLRQADLLDHPTAKAVLSIPGGMLVYVHQRGGRVEYLSGRSVEGKRHYNLPGDKVIYHNSPATIDTDDEPSTVHVLVEGQADAIALGQYGIEATALCALDPTNGVLPGGITHVALDNDKPGRKAALDLALKISPTIGVVTWPTNARNLHDEHGFVQIKDAGDLVQTALTRDEIHDQISAAPPALFLLARTAAKERDEGKRVEIQRQVLDAFTQLDDLTQTNLKPRLAKALDVGVQQLGRLIKARNSENGEGNSPERYEYSAGDYIGGILFEQCVQWQPDGRGISFYMVRQPNGKIEKKTSVDVGGITYLPHPPEAALIHRKMVLFPELATDYGDQRQLLNDVQNFIHTYLDVDPFYEKLASYYILFSWLYDLFETLPYLRAIGDYGTGKSRFLSVFGSISFRPMFTAGATTVSPIFRIIDMFRGTLIIDEADFSNSDTESEMIKIINLGYDKRQGYVLRSEKDPNVEGGYYPAAFYVYGPKIMATRKEFQDKATESRCLTKRMSSARPRPDIPYILQEDFWQAAQEIRNKLLMYRLKSHRPIRIDMALADRSIEPRLNQVIMALKATIDDQDMTDEISRFMSAYNNELIGKRGQTLPALVLQAVVHIWHNGADMYGNRDLTMKGIATKVQEYIDEWDPGEKITARRVTEILGELGLNGRDKAASGPYRGRQMLKTNESELNSLMLRYGIEPPEPSTETA